MTAFGQLHEHSDPQDFDPEEFRALIYNSPMSTRVRWWRALPDPTFNKTAGQAATATGGAKFIRTEQQQRNFRVLPSGLKTVKRYLQQGQFENSDMSFMFMPDEFLISDHDWVCPIGRVDGGTLSTVNAPVNVYKDYLIRGSVQLPQAGTVSSSARVITGVGTQFTQLNVADVITANKIGAKIVSIASDTTLTIDRDLGVAWNANAYSRGVERLLHDTAVGLDSLADAGTDYVLPSACQIGPDAQTLVWVSAAGSPEIGVTIGVVYRYLPKYLILPDAGTHRRTVDGIGMPWTVVGRLYNPETHRSP